MSHSLFKRLLSQAPGIDWSDPLPVKVYAIPGDPGYEGFLCRVCVAELGFSWNGDRDRVFANADACRRHVVDAHGGAGPVNPTR